MNVDLLEVIVQKAFTEVEQEVTFAFQGGAGFFSCKIVLLSRRFVGIAENSYEESDGHETFSRYLYHPDGSRDGERVGVCR